MTKEEIIDGLEIYTVGRSNKAIVHITVEELQKFIEAIKALEQEPKRDKFDHQAKWLLNGLKVQIYALADEKGNQLDLEDVMKIIDADKES